MSNEILGPVISKYVDSYWHNKKTPYVLALLVFTLFILTQYSTFNVLRALLLVLLILLVFYIWQITNTIPVTHKGLIGIVFSIKYEEEAEAKQIEIDLIRTLRNLIDTDLHGSKTTLIILPSFVSNSLNTIVEYKTILKKTRGRLLFYGAARKRNHESVHFIDFNVLVNHDPIPQPLSDVFSRDISQTVPLKFLVPVESELLKFELTSKLIDVGSRYILGVASMLSGNVGYAETLFLGIEERLPSISSQERAPIITTALKQRFIELYTMWLNAIYAYYFQNRDKESLTFAENVADRLLRHDSCNYQALLVKTIAAFILHRNIPLVKELLSRCQGIKDAAWKYSQAFISTYEGNLDTAHDQYREAFRENSPNDRIAVECEDFINIVLKEEPGRKQLYFALGLINYNSKCDYASALRDFITFLESDTSMVSHQILKLVHDLITRCNEKLASNK